MNNIIKSALFFIAGAASASFITYKVVEKKFKDIADEEIASVKAMYERKLKKVEPEDIEKAEEQVKEINDTVNLVNVNPYTSLVSGLGYSNTKREEKEDMNKGDDTEYSIEVIPPEDFGEYGYKCESLTYYADKVLTYDNGVTILDIDTFVGHDALNTFGEYEDDSVFVRNHSMKTDFEILLDSRKYSDVVGDDED